MDFPPTRVAFQVSHHPSIPKISTNGLRTLPDALASQATGAYLINAGAKATFAQTIYGKLAHNLAHSAWDELNRYQT